jgi:hypothetical protein
LQKRDTIDFFDVACSDIVVATRKGHSKGLNGETVTEDSIARILPKTGGLYNEN